MPFAAPRWLRSVRRRPAAFLAILMLSAGAALVSSSTPMLLQAVDAVSLRHGVADAVFPANGVSFTAYAQPVTGPAPAEAQVSNALGAVAVSSDRWGPAEQVDEVQIVPRLFVPGSAPFAARLSVDPGGCTGLRVTGRCPASVFEAALPASLARSTGWGVGTAVTAKVPDPGGSSAYETLGTIRVVGVYDDAIGHGRAVADPTRLVARTVARSVPNLLVGQDDLERLNAPVQVIGAIVLARPVSAADLPALRKSLDAAQRAVLDAQAAEVASTFRTGLGALLDSIAEQQTAGAVLATPIGLQAVLLAWIAVAAIAQRAARSRAAEWGVGRMRGARVRAWLSAVFTEPLAAILLGTLLGALLALVVAQLAVVVLLGSTGSVVPFIGAMLAGAGLAAAGSLVALVAASVRAALLPLPQLLQETAEPRRTTRPALVLQVAEVSLATAVLWSALTTARFDGQQLGLLLPAMLSLLAGLVAVQVGVLVVRRVSRRAPRTLEALVVGRGLARAPSVLAAAQLMLVSAALAASALQLGLLSSAAQTDRAELATGASRVLTVDAPDGELLAAVRRADPSGGVAMAAEQIVADPRRNGGKVLAVDSSRLAAVSTWRPEWRRGVRLDRLRSSGDARPPLRGTTLTVELGRTTQGSTDGSGDSDVVLRAIVARPAGWTTIDVGPVRDGRASVDIPCASGCRLVALTLDDLVNQTWAAQLTVEAISTDRQQASAWVPWLRADRWRDRVVDQQDPTRPARARAADDPRGLVVSAQGGSSLTVAQLEPAVGDALVPAILGSEASLTAFPGVRSAVVGTSLANAPVLMRPLARTTAVPRALRTGVLVDLGEMLRAEDPALVGAEQQVWLAPTGQRAVIAALRAQGVRVTGDERAATAVAAGLATATDRAMSVAEVTALIGVGFGLLALVAARVIDMGERRREWATLRLAGVPARRLRRLALLQTVLPASLGVLIGVVVGSESASLIGGRLPLLVGVTAGPPLPLGVPLAPLTALAVVVVLLVVAASAVVTALEVRSTR